MGFIKLVNEKFDLCDHAKDVDEKCPFHEGLWNVSKKADIPKGIPPGKFVVEMKAYMDETERELITCMKGEVDFSGTG